MVKLDRPRFGDIPLFTQMPGHYVDVQWAHLLEYLEHHQRAYGLDLAPDFQRAHVWTEAQQVAFVEYVLRGGMSGIDLFFNHPDWGSTLLDSPPGSYVIVDGKQRLHAVVRFLRDEVRAFGYRYRDFEDSPRFHLSRFRWHINTLRTRREVLTWYCELNTGGTPHTPEEIARVRALLAAEGQS